MSGDCPIQKPMVPVPDLRISFCPGSVGLRVVLPRCWSTLLHCQAGARFDIQTIASVGSDEG